MLKWFQQISEVLCEGDPTWVCQWNDTASTVSVLRPEKSGNGFNLNNRRAGDLLKIIDPNSVT